MEVQELRKLFTYCPDTGVITNATRRGRRAKVGLAVHSKDTHGYLYARVHGKNYSAHRMAWALHYGEWPPKDMQVDHINRVRDDNRACNLRLVTNQINQWNRGPTPGRELPTGVSRNRSRFRAHIRISGVQFYLGTFGTPEEAGQAYLAAKEEHHTITEV